jgi:hypothetical protein
MPDRIVDLPVANQLVPEFEKHKHLIPGQEVGRAEGAEPGVTIVKMAMPEAPETAVSATIWFSLVNERARFGGIHYYDADGEPIT